MAAMRSSCRSRQGTATLVRERMWPSWDDCLPRTEQGKADSPPRSEDTNFALSYVMMTHVLFLYNVTGTGGKSARRHQLVRAARNASRAGTTGQSKGLSGLLIGISLLCTNWLAGLTISLTIHCFIPHLPAVSSPALDPLLLSHQHPHLSPALFFPLSLSCQKQIPSPENLTTITTITLVTLSMYLTLPVPCVCCICLEFKLLPVTPWLYST